MSSASLERYFFEEEVYKSFMQCSKDKAPEPYGFNIGFLQKFLYVIKNDIMELFKELHDTGAFV